MSLFSRRDAQPVDPQQVIDSQNRTFEPPAGVAVPFPAALAPAGAAFRMAVEDVFTIKGRGVVATGTVAAGSITVGGELDVMRDGRSVLRTKVKSIEAFRKTLTSA